MKPLVIARVRYYKPDANRRSFYASAQADDYLTYIDKGSKSKTYADYLNYAGNEEKSAGVFGKNGLLTKPQKKGLREKLRTTESCIWDVILSFEQEYGTYHLRDTEDARALLNARLNRFFRQAGLNPENVTWSLDYTKIRITDICICAFLKTNRYATAKTTARKNIFTMVDFLKVQSIDLKFQLKNIFRIRQPV